MAGKILVSVQEFMGVPLSLPSSPISIKVSMGKVEYQTSDKGDFSFPLTTLRDNLIVALLDADGKEVSHAGIATKSIVEKGLWDDLFPLEGGGHVHMKLQFVRSEEQSNRIRMMRASALKTKHDELLKSSQSATTAGSDVGSSLSLSHEASAINVEEVASKACLVSNPIIFCEDEKSGSESIKGIIHDQKQLTPVKHSLPLCRNDADQYEEFSSAMPVSQGVDVHLTEVSHRELVEKSESKSLPAESHTRAICSYETPLISRDSGLNVAATSNSIPHNLEKTRVQKQTQLGKTPSNVRKMISAFESGLAQDMRSPIKPLPTESQSSQSGIEASLKSQHLNKGKKPITKPEHSISGRAINPLLAQELQHGPTYIRKRGEQINLLGGLHEGKSSQHTGQLEELNTEKFQIKRTISSLENKFKVVHKEVDRVEEKSHQDLMRISTFETTMVSGRMLDEHSDEARRLSVTTGGREAMDLMGGCSMKPEIHQGKLNLSMPENVEEQSVDSGTAIEVKKDEKTCHKIRESKHERAENIETSGGPVGQVVKVAIMIGFGLLVLLTRQK